MRYPLFTQRNVFGSREILFPFKTCRCGMRYGIYTGVTELFQDHVTNECQTGHTATVALQPETQ